MGMPRGRRVSYSKWIGAIFCVVGVIHCELLAQLDFETPPIDYHQVAPRDPVNRLADQLAAGDLRLEWDRQFGWLPAVLDALEIPRSSQTLVFSKTSLQFRQISRTRPRALYFNDQIYVGWVPNADVLEIGGVDPHQGAIFYTVKQQPDAINIRRDRNGECLACHANARTEKVPGFLVRSVYSHRDGQPEFRLGSITTDHTTPLHERFGGWYVTGSTGKMRHRGGAVLQGRDDETLDLESFENRETLPRIVRAANYLEPTSDVVALMLLEHQTQMHNRITRASYAARQAMHQQVEMNRILERPKEYVSESTQRRINTAADKLVAYLLFSGEFKFTDVVQGRGDYLDHFQTHAIRDSEGRSLRDLDLEKRLLRYPCSYLIYSPSFAALPVPILKRVKQRMTDVLKEGENSTEFEHLTAQDRRDIWAILQQTHPLFVDSEKAEKSELTEEKVDTRQSVR